MINAKSKLLNRYYQRNPIKLDKANTYNDHFCSVMSAIALQLDSLRKDVLSRCDIRLCNSPGDLFVPGLKSLS